MNDLIQRQQALDISQSFIVQAPAGSGKTELLTQRYLKLLSTCSEPENVLAMTFTNKAVDELTERVLLSLKSTNHPRPEQAHKQITYDLAHQAMQRSDLQGWDLLQNPKRLKILTIDGLDSLIVNRYPLENQLVPRQIMAESWQRDNAYRYAAEQTLLMIDDAQYGEAIAQLLLYLDNNIEKFYGLVTKMLTKRNQWLTHLYRDGVLNPQALKNSAKMIVKEHLAILQPLAEQHLDEDFFGLLSAREGQSYCLPTSNPADLQAWQSIADLCLTKSGTWRKAVNKLKADLSEQVELGEALQQLNQLPDIDFSQAQIDILAVIATVLKLCVAHLKVHFETQQAQDFIEVSLNANEVLGEQSGVSDIALFLDYKVQHLLIDEFQDTSASQFNTIEKLIGQWQENQGKTLFLVGDPMQSIYRFRESQVGLFLQVKEKGIADIAPKSLILSTNFRSSKSIVESNNTFFQAIFPQQNNLYQGAICYSHSQANSIKENKNAVVFHPFAHQQSLREAQRVSEIVKTTLANDTNGTIAVLVRSRPHLQVIMQQLKQDDIAFESIEIMKLENHLLIRDLFSLTKALLHLGDKLAWLSVLRAPWCALVLDDLLWLSEGDIIYQQLSNENILSKMSQEGRARATHLHNCLRTVIDNQGRFDFVELLSYALNQLGLTQSALSSTEVAIKEDFLQIIFNCEQQQSLDIKTIKSAMKGLYASSDTAQVKLMTIHQSKGLEFDSVIIPGLGKPPRNNDSPIVYMREFSNQSLLLAPIKSASETDNSNTYQYLKFIESQQDKFETMRLLYVAMTRARSELHLLGAVGKNGKASKNSLLNLLMPFYQNNFEDIDTESDEPEYLEAPLLHRFNPLKAPIKYRQETGEEVLYQQNFERLFKRILGTLIHEYYQYEMFEPSAANIRNRLIEIGTAPSDIDTYQTFITRLLNNTKNDSQFEWLFKKRDSTLNEAEFFVDGSTIIIDKLFIDDKDILWIIDFKTAEPAKNEPLAQFIKRQKTEHTEQLLFYKQALSKIYDNPVHCALYCPSVPVLIKIDDA
ncbi:ATP-dependent DNA helicase pcrA [uncultured Candidatus Thioglobus sp.]|nr:ATP-dependent DNA helicase pcrA [uncultured Candidatus Thioglobus sp.]